MKRMRAIQGVAVLIAAATVVLGQPAPGGHMPGGPHAMPHSERGRGMMSGPGGKWWDNPQMVKELGLTPDQQKKMDDIFQQSRLKLIDLHATLEKEEVMMDGLMQGPQLDDSKIMPAIDRIAQARAELEKANARFLLGIRHALTPEQFKKLEAGSQRPSSRGGRGTNPELTPNHPDNHPRGMGPRPQGGNPPPPPPAQ